MTDYSLQAEVLNVTETGAVLQVAGQTLIWPNEALPSGTKAGDRLRLSLLTETMAEQEQHERARAILTEILGGKS